MENDRGTGPATPRSPALSASDSDLPFERQVPLRAFSQAAAVEITHHGAPLIPLEAMEEDGGEAAEIERMFKSRLKDLRRLPRSQRALALRIARECRQIALKELRERRARERHTRYMLWQMRLPPPRLSP
jgi:hypothetical protein